MKNFILEFGSVCDIGDCKPTNQDCIFSVFSMINNNSVGLFAVADGMGGLSHGEEVSRLVTARIEKWWNTEFRQILLSNNSIDSNEINISLDRIVNKINDEALAFSVSINEKAGSTLSLLLIVNDDYFIKNLGDSRVYLHNKKLRQITEDQSLVAQMVRNGEITSEEAKTHKKRNVITMCIGVFNKVAINSYYGKCRKNDIFLLCSDGLYNALDEKSIVSIIGNKKSLMKECASNLRNSIPKGRAGDNVSVILVKLIPYRTDRGWFRC